jgi:hypothetical protein
MATGDLSQLENSIWDLHNEWITAWLILKRQSETVIQFVLTSLLHYGNADVTGHATVAAAVVSIKFGAQLFVDSPLLTFFCFISCSVFVADSSWASAIGFVDTLQKMDWITKKWLLTSYRAKIRTNRFLMAYRNTSAAPLMKVRYNAGLTSSVTIGIALAISLILVLESSQIFSIWICEH